MGIGGRPGYHRATVVGGGVIGISWTALFLAHGLEVTVCDPLPDVAERVRAGLREIAPTLAQLGLSVDALTGSTDALRFDPDAASAVAGTDVVQENGPQRPGANSSCGRRSRPAPRRTPCSPPPPLGSRHQS
jgi:ketoreductase RED1